MASEAKRIPDSEWEKHRVEIIRLYYDENKSQKVVSKHMSEIHDFVASKWQYERQFEKWKLKKNHSPATWNSLRGAGNTSSSIIYHGRAVAEKKAKKAMTRYKNSATSADIRGALSPGFSSAATTTNMPTNMLEIRAHISMLVLTPSLLAWNIFNNQSVVQPLPPGYTNHFTQSLAALGNDSWELVTRNSHGAGIVQGLDFSLPIGPQAATNVRAILPLSTLISIKVPPDIPGDGQVTSYSQSDAVMLHAMIHALSNDMIERLGFDNLGELWLHVKTRFGAEVPKILMQIIRSSYSGDLCRKIFQAVIEANDAACLRQIIRTWNINVDDMACFGSNRERFSAVELAAGLMYPDVLSVLLAEGSDVNKAGAFQWGFLPRNSQHTLGAGIVYLYNHIQSAPQYRADVLSRPILYEKEPKYQPQLSVFVSSYIMWIGINLNIEIERFRTTSNGLETYRSLLNSS
ncbi:Clr5 domain-containing protein [Microdochium nivale]|nr:Clr5 domain-containing protein [Microdochium nivale]